MAIDLGTVSADTTRINIFSVGSGLANVGGVSFAAATRTSRLDVFLGTGVIPQFESLPIPAVANNWGGLNVNAATQQWIRLSAGIAGDLTGPVFADTINRLQIGGVQGGAIDASATLGDALDIKYVRALSGGGTGATITTPGAIGTIEMTGVALPNAITATISAGEFIQTIECAGLIGNDNVRPSIVARDGIGSIVAEQINANIRANANGGQGALGRIEVSSRVVDAMRGSIEAAALGDGSGTALLCSGGFRANVTVGDINGNLIFGGNLNPSNTTFRSTGVLRGEVTVVGSARNLIFNDIGCIPDSANPLACDPTKRSVIRLLNGIGELTLGNVLGDPSTDPGPSIISPYIGRLAAGRFWGYVADFSGSSWVSQITLQSLSDSVTVEWSPDTVEPGTLLFVTRSEVIDVRESIEALPTSDGGPIMLLEDMAIGSLIRVGEQLQDGIGIGLLSPTPNPFRAQVILNAANMSNPAPFGTAGSGSVAIRADESLTYVVDQLSYPYSFTTETLGRGAVGVVPYTAHLTASQLEPIVSSKFNGVFPPGIGLGDPSQEARLEFYGPVTVGEGSTPPFEVALMNPQDPQFPLLDVSRFVTFVRPPIEDRVVRIGLRDPAIPLPSGEYRVTARPGTNLVTCANLFPTVPAAQVEIDTTFEFRFVIVADCAGGGPGGLEPDGIPDATSAGVCGDVTLCDSIDFNNDGVFPDDQDAIDFFDVLAGESCIPCSDIDFNNNFVFPEQDDVIQFMHVFSGGTCD